MAFVHPTKYRFYMQKYPDGNQMSPLVDVEEQYDCRYMRFDGTLFDGDIQNVYTESFAERSGDNVWTPKQGELACKSKECTLKLRFRDGDVESRARKFYEDFRGVKVEYGDTFRKRFVSLILIKEPKIEFERITEESSYLVVSYTFLNFLGRSYTKSIME